MAEERFFIVHPENIHKNSFSLDKAESYHYIKVLRGETGQTIWLLDGQGTGYEAIVTTLNEKKVSGRLISSRKNFGEPEKDIHLALGLIKGDRMETAIEKAVELGVRSIQPLLLNRCIRKKLNKNRTEKIIRSAIKQCGRSRFPLLHEVKPLKDWIQATKDEFRGVAHETGTQTLQELLSGSSTWESLHILVGPEGDFSDQEQRELKRNAIPTISLGPRRLRSETAAIAFLTLVSQSSN